MQISHSGIKFKTKISSAMFWKLVKCFKLIINQLKMLSKILFLIKFELYSIQYLKEMEL